MSLVVELAKRGLLCIHSAYSQYHHMMKEEIKKEARG